MRAATMPDCGCMGIVLMNFIELRLTNRVPEWMTTAYLRAERISHSEVFGVFA